MRIEWVYIKHTNYPKYNSLYTVYILQRSVIIGKSWLKNPGQQTAVQSALVVIGRNDKFPYIFAIQ